MKIIKQYVELEEKLNGKELLEKIERAGRTCYKSEDLAKEGSAERFVRNIIKSGHESVIEHVSISVRIITNRGNSHEIVRHRIASYSQASTRYCSYNKDKFGNELTFIEPIFDKKHNTNEEEYMKEWVSCMREIEKTYLNMTNNGVLAEYARDVLPNSLETEIVCTMNLRAWRNFLKLRMSKNAHPQIRDIAFKIFDIFYKELPVVFEDLLDIRNEN